MRRFSNSWCVIILGVWLSLLGMPVMATQTAELAHGDGLSVWSFSNGGEFPGAQGDIALVHAGTEAPRLQLRYDFSKGGRYVALGYYGVFLPGLQAIQLRAAPSADCYLGFRVIDANGRTFQGTGQKILAHTAQVLSQPISGPWGGAWGGNEASTQPVLPLRQIVLTVGPDGAATVGSVVFDQLTAVTSHDEISISREARRATPLLTDATAASTGNGTYYPAKVSQGRYTANIGYTGPSESKNDARDLRISEKTTDILAFWGRVGLLGSTTYFNPQEVKVHVTSKHGTPVWQWGDTDSRTGFQYNCRTTFDEAGVTSTIALRCRTAHDGKIVLPFCLPQNVAADYAGGTGTADHPYGVSTSYANTTKITYTINGHPVTFLLSYANPTGVAFRPGEGRVSYTLGGYRNFSQVEITPPDGKSFPAGYENAVQLRVTWNSREIHPATMTRAAWDTGVNLSWMEQDAQGKWSIPQMPQPRYFLPGTPQALAVAIENLSSARGRTIKFDYTVRDYTNTPVMHRSLRISLAKAGMNTQVIPCTLGTGIYALTVRAIERGRVLQERTCRFAVLSAPSTLPGSASYFGIDSRVPPSPQNMKLMQDFGMHTHRGHFFELGAQDPDHFITVYDAGNAKSLLRDFGPEKFKTIGPKWEIVNEPDIRWQPDQYVDNVRQGAEFIKSQIPDATILACGVSGGDSDNDFGFLKAFLNGGGAQYTDIIPIHPYSSVRTFGPGLSPVSPEENNLLDKLRIAQELARAHHLRLWIGEIGYMNKNCDRYPQAEFFADERMYANYLTRLYLLGRCVPDLERVYWYELSTDDTSAVLYPDTNGSYSLLGVANNVTPAIVAFANMASLTDGATFVKQLAFPQQHLYGVQQQRDGQNILALWSVKTPSTLVFPWKTPLRCVSTVGATSTLQPVQGKISLHLSDAPCYLLFPTAENSLVERIEQADIEPDQLVTITNFGIADGKRLLVQLHNHATRALTARITLTHDDTHESWPVQLAPNQETTAEYPLTHGVSDQEKNVDVTLTVEVAGQLATATQRLNDTKQPPELLAVRTAQPPVIDGSLDEWRQASPIKLDQHELVSPPDPDAWKGPEDLSATGYFMYDDKNLYFACQVRDDIQKNDDPFSSIWNGDCIQLGFGNMSFPYAYVEINIGLSSKDGAITYMSYGDQASKMVDGAKVAVTRNDHDGTTTYELAIPFTAFKGIFIYPGGNMHCAFIVTDVDKGTLWKYIATKDPALIGINKDSSLFPVLHLQP